MGDDAFLDRGFEPHRPEGSGEHGGIGDIDHELLSILSRMTVANPSSPARLPDVVAGTLRRRILSGELVAGRLPAHRG